jgi:hypothetical protein
VDVLMMSKTLIKVAEGAKDRFKAYLEAIFVNLLGLN